MSKSLQPLPKRAHKSYRNDNEWSPTCELDGVAEGDVSPCSHFDHCERDAVIWVYDKDNAPFAYGLCQQCYDFLFPSTAYWYRVVHILPEFKGKL